MSAVTTPLPQRLSIEEFRRGAEVRELTNHGRGYEVFYAGVSLGFADRGDPVGQVHRREVNNALYCSTREAPDFMRGAVLPSLAALQSYPDLVAKFPREHYLASMEPEWMPAYAEAAAREGWNLFDADGVELQVQREDEADVLKDDADAWRLVFYGAEDHHIVARVIISRDSPQEWDRMVKAMREAPQEARGQKQEMRG